MMQLCSKLDNIVTSSCFKLLCHIAMNSSGGATDQGSVSMSMENEQLSIYLFKLIKAFLLLIL